MPWIIHDKTYFDQTIILRYRDKFPDTSFFGHERAPKMTC